MTREDCNDSSLVSYQSPDDFHFCFVCKEMSFKSKLNRRSVIVTLNVLHVISNGCHQNGKTLSNRLDDVFKQRKKEEEETKKRERESLYEPSLVSCQVVDAVNF